MKQNIIPSDNNEGFSNNTKLMIILMENKTTNFTIHLDVVAKEKKTALCNSRTYFQIK